MDLQCIVPWIPLQNSCYDVLLALFVLFPGFDYDSLNWYKIRVYFQVNGVSSCFLLAPWYCIPCKIQEYVFSEWKKWQLFLLPQTLYISRHHGHARGCAHIYACCLLGRSTLAFFIPQFASWMPITWLKYYHKKAFLFYNIFSAKSLNEQSISASAILCNTHHLA